MSDPYARWSQVRVYLRGQAQVKERAVMNRDTSLNRPDLWIGILVEWFKGQEDRELAAVLRDIADTPISPELLPTDEKGDIAQKTESVIGPFELKDFFIFQMLRNGFSPRKIMFLAGKAFGEVYDSATIRKWLLDFYKRFFTSQFKRNGAPDGPKVGSVSLSQRGDWRMPSDVDYQMWMKELDSDI